MRRIVIDMETYYDSEYSLSKMQTDEYILANQFEVIGFAYKLDDDEPVWVTGDATELYRELRELPWDECAAVCHNTLFDGFILTQFFDIKPKLWMDTLSMGRMLLPWLPSHSLAKLAEHYGLQAKGTEVQNALGMRRTQFTPGELAAYGAYCCNDVEITDALAKLMLPHTPPLELRLIDMTIRMFTEPKLVGDTAAMENLLVAELKRKEELLEAAQADKDTLMSNDKLAERLMSLGVAPPRKLSARTGKEAWAFAKSDRAFTDLLEHESLEVSSLVAARLGVKTTIAETRTTRFIGMSNRGPLPVALSYWGAKTTGRFSGTNKVNWQNLPARGISAGLRNAIMAPDGHVIVVGDSSGIELRVAMVLARQLDLVDKIAQGADLYCDFASKIFGRTITKADKMERLLGKIAMLSLQYGAGWVKFKEMVRLQGGGEINDSQAQHIVDLYRSVHSAVTGMWQRFDRVVLPEIASGCPNLITVDDNGWLLCANEGFSLHGQPGVRYHNLKKNTEGDWVYQMGREYPKIYGGKCMENACQYLARMIVMWQTAKINSQFPVALSVHDEAVCVVPKEQELECVSWMTACLSEAPPWCRGSIPLSCEVGVGESYGTAKS